MSEEQATVETEPRWKAAGPPYLLTREELLAELRKRGIKASDRQIKSWVTYGLIPRPTRRAPPGAAERRAHALYPIWTVGLVVDLLARLRLGASIEELKSLAPQLSAVWEERDYIFVTPATPEQPENAAVRQRVMGQLSFAVEQYTEYVTKVYGRFVVHAQLVLFFEDGTSEAIGLRPYKPAPTRAELNLGSPDD